MFNYLAQCFMESTNEQPKWAVIPQQSKGPVILQQPAEPVISRQPLGHLSPPKLKRSVADPEALRIINTLERIEQQSGLCP